MEPNNAKNSEYNQPLDDTAKKPKVLVVDDSRIVRVTVRKFLSAEFEVLEAVDGEDGWNVILQNQDLKAVLTDAGMPKLDGYELITRVREFSDNVISKLPMVMITGAEEGQTELRQKALGLGASDFIIKPFDKAQMIARMRSYVKQDSLQRDLKTTEQTLATHATIDPLTKLNNLRYFLKRTSQELALATRHKSNLSLLGIRIDNIQQLHQKFDDQTFDKVVLWTVKRLQPLLRKEDILTYTGEGEFIIIAPATNRLSSAIFCDRIRRDVQKDEFSAQVLSLPISVSMGLVNNVSDALESAEKCLQLVRSRLQVAEANGGNRVIASDDANGQAAPAAASENVELEPSKPFDIRKSLSALTLDTDPLEKMDLTAVANQLLPLLEHIDKELDLDMKEQVESFREKLLQHGSKNQ